MEGQRPSGWQRFQKVFMDNLLTFLLIIGVTLGIVVGIVIALLLKPPLTDRQTTYLGFPGELLINMLKCSATPLITTCIIVAIGSLDMTIFRTIGWQFLIALFATKLVSSAIGIVISVLIVPGRRGAAVEEEEGEEKATTVADIFLDMFRNIIPGNLIRMYIQLYDTQLIRPEGKESKDFENWDFRIGYFNAINLLGMVFIATVIGLTLTILREKGKGLLVIAKGVLDVSMTLVTWILWCAPLLLFFLIVAEIAKIDDYGEFFATWGMYILTMHVALGIVAFVLFPFMLFVLAAVNPFKFYWDMSKALLTAYATASSVGTMPLLIECLLKHGTDERLVRFVVPIGINVNKDGAAAYLSLSTVFMAQLLGFPLSVGQYVTILILSAMGSIAAAAVPFSGFVVLVMILNGLGMKQHYAGGVLTVDWINDRISTFTNVLGNAVLCKMLSVWNKKLLQEGTVEK